MNHALNIASSLHEGAALWDLQKRRIENKYNRYEIFNLVFISTVALLSFQIMYNQALVLTS